VDFVTELGDHVLIAEHFLDMEGVRGSIPLPPTIKISIKKGLSRVVAS
jgi:hypothetical protein